MSEGLDKYQHLLDAGFPRADADAWRSQQTSTLQSAGFTQGEIDDYWGDGEKKTPGLDAAVAGNVEHNWRPEEADVAKGPLQYLAAGWDMSTASLGLQGPPKTIMPEYAGLMGNILYGMGQFAGDVPATVAGFIGGSAAGAAAGAETGPGALITATGGGLFGAGALPEAMRQVLMDHYRNGDFLTFSDFVARSSGMAWETAKAGTINLVGGKVGGAVGGKVLAKTGSLALGATAEAASYAASATSVGGALNGRVPNAEDFGTAAALVLGTHVAFNAVGATQRLVLTPRGEAVADNMRNIYAATGVTPWEQARRASGNGVIRQELLAQDANKDPVVPQLQINRPKEPEPYREPEKTVAPVATPAEVPSLSPEQQLDLVRQLERSGDAAVSPAGAVGRYQVMPGTARQYGYDPSQLTNPNYNAKVAKAVIADLSNRFRKPDGSVDQEAVLIGYNAGPGRAIQFRADGRQFGKLPVETQRYLEHADRLGAFSEGAGGGGKEPPKPPKIEGPAEPQDPFKLNSAMLADRINEITAQPVEPSMVNKAKGLLSRAYFEAFSELAPFKNLDKTLKLGEDDVGIEDMFRSTYASAGRADHFIRWGTLTPLNIDKDGNVENFKKTSDEYLFKGYEDAKAQGVSIAEVTAYRRSLRTIELAKRGIETPTDTKDAQAMVQKVGKKLKPVAELFDRVNDAKIDYMRDSGLLSVERAKAIKDQNRYWIPYNPAKEGGYSRTGSRFGPTQPLRKIKGGKYQTVDPVQQEIQSFHSAVMNADKNRATFSLMKVLTPEAKEALGLKQIEDKRPPLELFDQHGNPIEEPAKLLPPLSDNEFAYFDNGVRNVVSVDDPMLARAIRGASPVEAGTLLKTFRAFSMVKRTGIVEMPDYIARALAKDAVGAAVLEKWGGASLGQIWDAASHVIKVDDVFKDYVAKGGLGTALADMDANYVARDAYKLFEQTGTWNSIVNTVRHPLQAVGLMMQRVDSVMRLAEVQKQKAAGIEPFKATMRARKINLDFAEKGADPLINVVASIVPFFRPNMLGMDQLGRALKTNPLGVAVKGVAYMTAPVAALYALNYLQDQNDQAIPEDAKWANLPRWQKDTMFILPRVDGVRLRIPLPPIVGPLFGGLTNRVLDYFAENDPHAFDQWANTAAAQFLPPIVPALVMPIYEHIANQNAFTGRPLIPTSLEGASGYMQYQDYTSETAKRIAQWLGPPGLDLTDASPIVLENYVREWTGPLGQQILRVADAAVFPKTGKPWDFADIPVIGAFTVRNPGMSAQPIEDFYAGLKDVERYNKDFSLAMKRGNIDEMTITSQNDLAFVKMGQTADALATQRGVVDAINRDEDMTVDDKRQLLETIYTTMIAESKAGLEMIDTVRSGQ